MTDRFEIADLLVRCSGVSLGRIAAVLGFSAAEEFARWFEDHGGLHPETARGQWETQTTADEEVLVAVRQSLFSAFKRRDVAPLVRAMRSRQPIPAAKESSHG